MKCSNVNKRKQKTMSVGEEAAEKIGELFGRTKAFKANMASIIDKIIEERSANATTPPTRELPPTETGDTKRLNWLERNGGWLGDKNLRAKWTISIPTPDNNSYSPTRLREAIDAAMKGESK